MQVTGEASGEIRQLAPDVETLGQRLAAVDYLVDEGLATSMFLSLRLPQPLLLEGEAGVGKTEAGKSLAAVLDTPLIRLQCYEGIDAAESLYEWNYPRQLLGIRLAEARGSELREEDLFGPDYLIRRPLLRALEHPGPRPAVLLIDEIDRADDDFEAFLLELLAEAAVTIPELGTVRATHPPVIVLTSNRTRDLHDAVKRRCLYHWIDYPTPERELDIVRRRVSGASETLAVQVVGAVARMRDSDVQKPPGIAEAIDWLSALTVLGIGELDEAALERTLGSVLKYAEDQEVIRAAGFESLLAGAKGGRDGCEFTVDTIELDLPAVAGAFSRRLHDAGVPTSAERAVRFAESLALVRPISRRRLYWTARAVFVSDASQARVFDSVFFEVFGAGGAHEIALDSEVEAVPAPPHERRRGDHKTNPAGAGVARRGRDFAARWRPRAGPRPGGRGSDGRLRRGASARQALRRARARRARTDLPADGAPAGGHARAPHPARPARPPRRAHRHAPDAARQPADGR